MVASLVSTTSCSDWNDWNTAQTDPTLSAGETLWENITGNQELQNFKTILETVNMQETFQSSKFYTIWAPALTDAQRDSILALDADVIKEQFVNNHIAEYNHQAAGLLEERVHTLNDKAYNFVGNGSIYTFNNVKLAQTNIPNSNGTLHILESNSPFLPNAYQAMWMTDDVDSIANYFKQYELTYLDESQSVAGPIVNGRQTYIDSVMVTYNSMTNAIRASLNNEDSLYTFLLPNNDAYKKMYSAIKSLYKYKESTQGQDVKNAASTTYTTVTGTANVDYLNTLADSLTRRQIVNNLAYTHSNGFNTKFFVDGSLELDTIVSTYRRDKFSEPDKIVDEAHIVERITLSNGEAIVLDSLGFKPWETYNQENITSGTTACRTLNGSAVRKSISLPDSSMVDLTNGKRLSMLELTPTSAFSKPEADYYLEDVLSGTYRMYVVIPPASVDLTDTTTTVLPNWLEFTLNYYNGTRLTDIKFTNERYDPNDNVITTYNPTTGAEVKTTITNTDFFNDTTKVDTLYLGEVTFPYCYVGLTDVYPNLKVTCSTRLSTLSSRGHLNAFDRTIRISAIILRPLEYDKFLKDEE